MLKVVMVLVFLPRLLVSSVCVAKYSLNFALQNCKINFLSSEFNFNPKFIENMDFITFNNTSHDSCINSTFVLKKDVSRVLLAFDLNGKSGPQAEDYDTRIFRVNIDTCSWIVGSPFHVFIVKFIVDNIQQYSNFRFECPQRKQKFYVRNFPAPQFILDANIFIFDQWEITITARFKVTMKANAARGFVIIIRGRTVRS